MTKIHEGSVFLNNLILEPFDHLMDFMLIGQRIVSKYLSIFYYN